jgi:Nucleotidyltransferase domain
VHIKIEKQLQALVTELLSAEPSALAVMLFGSYSRGDEGPFSDIDVRVFTAAPPVQRDRVRIVGSDGRPVHWSIGSRTVAEKLTEIADPEQWPWAAAHYQHMRTLHDPLDILTLMRTAVERARPAPAAYAVTIGYDLETLLEYLAKVKNAALVGSMPDAVQAAVKVVHYCERLLRSLNPVQPFENEPAMEAYFRGLPVAPPNWAAERDLCLGVTGLPRTIEDVLCAAQSMALGTAGLLSDHVDELPFPDDVATALRDGRLRAYLMRDG